MKGFLERILQEIMKKILGTSDDLVNETIVPIDPMTQCIILKIVRFQVGLEHVENIFSPSLSPAKLPQHIKLSNFENF